MTSKSRENAARATEGAQEATYAAANGSTSVTPRSALSLNRRMGCCVLLGPDRCDSGPGVPAAGAARRAWETAAAGSCAALQELPGHMPGNAYSNPQDAANHARSHSVYDGSSGV